MNHKTLEQVEINPDAPPSATVIWLHGLGADGHDFESIVPMLGIPESLPIRYVFPHAPVRPVTINAGMRMRAWYDILDIQVDRMVDTEHLLESSDLLMDLMEREKASGMPSDRILLAGFSQGGAIVLHVGLRYAQPLAGILALSTYMPTADTLDHERDPANAAIPIMMGHGSHDPVVPLANGLSACRQLRGLGYDVLWREYPMLHQVCEEEIADIAQFFINSLDSGNL